MLGDIILKILRYLFLNKFNEMNCIRLFSFFIIVLFVYLIEMMVYELECI